jgi:hypothetical protein
MIITQEIFVVEFGKESKFLLIIQEGLPCIKTW